MVFENHLKKVKGKDNGRVILFALSTCQWCQKTKRLLAELGVEYSYVDVDLQAGAVLNEVIAELDKYNPRHSFPTIVAGKKVILGFDEDSIREVFTDG
jgi:glutaredoxin-like protein NrdH